MRRTKALQERHLKHIFVCYNRSFRKSKSVVTRTSFRLFHSHQHAQALICFIYKQKFSFTVLTLCVSQGYLLAMHKKQQPQSTLLWQIEIFQSVYYSWNRHCRSIELLSNNNSWQKCHHKSRSKLLPHNMRPEKSTFII